MQLQNLLESLAAAEYDGETIDLEVHVDGAASPTLLGKAPARIWCLTRGQYRVYSANSSSKPH